MLKLPINILISLECCHTSKDFPRDRIAEEHFNFPLQALLDYKDISRVPVGQNLTLPIPPFFTRAIEGWTTFIHPYTPHHAFAECSPWDTVRCYAHVLISSMTLVLETENRKQIEAASSQIAPLWHSVWIWLQILHYGGDSSFAPPTEGHLPPVYTSGRAAVFRMLNVLLYNKPQIPLREVLIKTERLDEIIATMWIDEGLDVNATNGFQASHLIRSDPLTAPPPFLLEIVARCGGNTDDVVRLLLCRIKHNIKQSTPDLESLKQDYNLLWGQLERDNTGIMLLRQAILFHPAFITTMVDMISLLLEHQRSQPTPLISECISIQLDTIFRHVYIMGFDSVLQLAETTILSLLTQISLASVSTPKSKAVYFSMALQIFIGRFTFYRPVFVLVRRSLMTPDVAHRRRIGLIGQHMIALQSHIGAWLKIRKLETQHVLDCGNLRMFWV
ncbi:hypothetical protein HWV62_34259 [Athelia sp. TMB]|nr:hypothetical protein HWV62_16550 [Athelia sp. TMB]KAF7981318.1 hypothetical protein HWV62_34259 [Athelia sp. TMB]